MEARMKRILIACAIAAGVALAATGAQAQHGGGGAYHGGGGGGGAYHGGGGGYHGGGYHSGGWHGGHFHGGHFHGSSVFIGGFWWPYYYGYPYPYYSYPAYSYYDYPSYGYYGYPDQGYGDQTYVEPGPSTQQAPMQQPPTQFYCPNTGYYPTVKTCPQGWLRVVPDNNAPPQ
jgi:hypothetical protein